MSQNESTPFLVTDAKNLTLIDATRENSPWCIWRHKIYIRLTDLPLAFSMIIDTCSPMIKKPLL